MEHFTIIGYRFCKRKKKYSFFFVTCTIIQRITSSEMSSLHLNHPRAHTLGAVDTVHSNCLSIVLCKCIDKPRQQFS